MHSLFPTFRQTLTFLIILLLFTGLSSCKKDQDLGNGYYYLPPYEAYDVGYPAKSALYKSTRKNVFQDIIAEGDVELIDFNEKWIAYVKRDSVAPFLERVGAYLINKNTNSIHGPYVRSEYNQMTMERLGLKQSFRWK